MSNAPIRNILIVGGGSAGWMSAAMLSRMLSSRRVSIQLIDLTDTELDLDSLDAGEASLPSIAELHAVLGIDEATLFRGANATISLGADFVDWPREGARAFRPFGSIGFRLDNLAFHHHWLRLRQSGESAKLSDYALAASAAKLGRFAPPTDDQASVLSTFDYAYHWLGSWHQKVMRDCAERRGVTRIEGDVGRVHVRGENGFIEAITLKDGRRLEADLFIDCSGARALLIQGALHAGYEDWRACLPCDRALAARYASAAAPAPFRTATAATAGWTWRIPLQGSVGHGHVYADAFETEEAARKTLGAALEGAPLEEPRLVKFASGRRMKAWSRNCVAIGASACVLDPLEPTALRLALKSVKTLAQLLPADKNRTTDEADEYNRILGETALRARDFVALRYLTTKAKTPFWTACRAMSAPDSLAYKRDLFEACGRVYLQDEETFLESDWAAAWLGQEVIPRAYSPLADTPDLQATRESLRRMRTMIRSAAEGMPTHRAFIETSLARADSRA
ncbi:MAG: tryptophan halogenase family protein [Terricaulis sp.]